MSARKLVVELTEAQARALFGAAVQRDTDLEQDDSNYGRVERARERQALDRAMRALLAGARAAGAELAP